MPVVRHRPAINGEPSWRDDHVKVALITSLSPIDIAIEQARSTSPAVNDDRWAAVKFDACPQGKRIIDVNHHRQEVRWFCDRCRKTHTYRVGAES